MMTRRAAHVALTMCAVLATVTVGPVGAAVGDDGLLLEHNRLTVTATGNRVVPVRLAQAGVWDLSREGDGVTGIAVDSNGAELEEHDEYGVALVSRGSNTGAVTTVMYAPDGAVVLVWGQTGRLGLPHPVDDARTCVRCELPAGDYDLFVFGPYRSKLGAPAPRITLKLEGLVDGVTAVADDAGRRVSVLASVSRSSHSAAVASDTRSIKGVFPVFFDGAQRDGVYLSQATVTTSSDRASGGELTLSGHVNERSRNGPTDRTMPLQGASSRTAWVTPGAGRHEARISVPATLDRDNPSLHAETSVTHVNPPPWRLDVAILWLTTRTVIPNEAATSPEAKVDVGGWTD